MIAPLLGAASTADWIEPPAWTVITARPDCWTLGLSTACEPEAGPWAGAARIAVWCDGSGTMGTMERSLAVLRTTRDSSGSRRGRNLAGTSLVRRRVPANLILRSSQ